MDDGRIRAWWSHRQGLDGSLQGKRPHEVLERSGWARSVGGVGPYLTIHARAGASRDEMDSMVPQLAIHELPCARGCTYVVPAQDFAVALRVGQEFGEAAMKVAYRLGVTDDEIDKLCLAVLDALDGGPLDPEGIRDATGGAARSLGDEGKRKGVTTTLPLALGKLQAVGEIRRIPANGRLDQQRYQYARWRPNPLAGCTLTTDEAYTELARRYFRWIGPATYGEFQWFSGLGVKASKTAVEPLGLVPLEAGSERLMFDDDREDFMAYQAPAEPQYTLVSSLDALSAHRRDVATLLDPADLDHPIFGGKSTAAGGALSDLAHHAILDRGRLAGFWDFDCDRQAIVWMTLRPESDALNAAVEATELFIREQLGDARSFSLDSPKSRVPRLEALRAAGGAN
ncbi:MAG: hypothetical protein QOF51_1858 [Chloroflexota bacterium]|nr:hypothetical protein [Chloroflexota bacterium]